MKKLVFIIVAMLLVGCGTTTELVYRDRYHYDPIPATLMQRCEIPAPVTRQEFMAMSDNEQKQYLSSRSITLAGEVRKCNSRLEGIQTRDKEQTRIIQEKNAQAEQQKGK